MGFNETGSESADTLYECIWDVDPILPPVFFPSFDSAIAVLDAQPPT